MSRQRGQLAVGRHGKFNVFWTEQGKAQVAVGVCCRHTQGNWLVEAPSEVVSANTEPQQSDAQGQQAAAKKGWLAQNCQYPGSGHQHRLRWAKDMGSLRSENQP